MIQDIRILKERMDALETKIEELEDPKKSTKSKKE